MIRFRIQVYTQPRRVESLSGLAVEHATRIFFSVHDLSRLFNTPLAEWVAQRSTVHVFDPHRRHFLPMTPFLSLLQFCRTQLTHPHALRLLQILRKQRILLYHGLDVVPGAYHLLTACECALDFGGRDLSFWLLALQPPPNIVPPLVSTFLLRNTNHHCYPLPVAWFLRQPPSSSTERFRIQVYLPGATTAVTLTGVLSGSHGLFFSLDDLARLLWKPSGWAASRRTCRYQSLVPGETAWKETPLIKLFFLLQLLKEEMLTTTTLKPESHALIQLLRNGGSGRYRGWVLGEHRFICCLCAEFHGRGVLAWLRRRLRYLKLVENSPREKAEKVTRVTVREQGV